MSSESTPIADQLSEPFSIIPKSLFVLKINLNRTDLVTRDPAANPKLLPVDLQNRSLRSPQRDKLSDTSKNLKQCQRRQIHLPLAHDEFEFVQVQSSERKTISRVIVFAVDLVDLDDLRNVIVIDVEFLELQELILYIQTYIVVLEEM